MNLRSSTTVLILLCFLGFLFGSFLFRKRLDQNGTYVSSDGAIKLYEAYGYAKNENFFECVFPAKKFGFGFSHFPFRYPWAIFPESKTPAECYFQYPPFFSLLGSAMLFFGDISLAQYLPLVFYGLAFLIFYSILVFLNPAKKNSYFLIFLSAVFLFTFPIITIFDFSENSLFHLFSLISLFYILKALSVSKENQFSQELITRKFYFYSGIFFGISVILRTESIILFGIFFLFYCFLFQDAFQNFPKKVFYLSLGVFLFVIPFLIFNWWNFHSVLGARFESQFDHGKTALSLLQRLEFWKAYLWKDKVMVGIFQHSPFIIPFFFFILSLRKNHLPSLVYSTGLIYILFTPFLFSVYGGVGYLGLRYLEPGYFFFLLGSICFLVEKFPDWTRLQKIVFSILVLALLNVSVRNTWKGLKEILNASLIQKEFNRFLQESDRIYVHTSIYDSIMIGMSFIENFHIYSDSPKDLEVFRGKKIIVSFPPKNPFISVDIPKAQHSFYFPKYSIDQIQCKIIKQKEIAGVNLYLVEMAK